MFGACTCVVWVLVSLACAGRCLHMAAARCRRRRIGPDGIMLAHPFQAGIDGCRCRRCGGPPQRPGARVGVRSATCKTSRKIGVRPWHRQRNTAMGGRLVCGSIYFVNHCGWPRCDAHQSSSAIAAATLQGARPSEEEAPASPTERRAAAASGRPRNVTDRHGHRPRSHQPPGGGAAWRQLSPPHGASIGAGRPAAPGAPGPHHSPRPGIRAGRPHNYAAFAPEFPRMYQKQRRGAINLPAPTTRPRAQHGRQRADRFGSWFVAVRFWGEPQRGGRQHIKMYASEANVCAYAARSTQNTVCGPALPISFCGDWVCARDPRGCYASPVSSYGCMCTDLVPKATIKS